MLPRYGPLGASSRLRMFQYVPALESAGIQVRVAPLLDDAYVRGLHGGSVPVSSILRGYAERLSALVSLQDCDAVWLEKEALPWMPSWLELALLGTRLPLIVDYDDAVFHRYDQHGNPLVRRLLGRKIDAVMRRADLVTAGNGYLAERAASAGCRRVERLPTVVDLDRYRVAGERMRDGPVVIGWIGSPSTAGYLRQLDPALRALAREHVIRCVAVGARADQVQGALFERREWTEESEVNAITGFDIGIMPLPDEPWERGKCGYKLIQYMACGVPVVASPVGVNTEIVTPGVNGALAATPEQWLAALAQLADDPELRARQGAEGRRRVEAWYSLQAQAPRLVGMLQEAVRRGRA